MSTFPLYNQIQSKIESIELLDDDKDFFIETVKKLSEKEHELMFALVRTHQIQNNDSTFYILPYNAKYQKKGIKFDFDRLPVELQNILLEFVRMHLSVHHALGE